MRLVVEISIDVKLVSCKERIKEYLKNTDSCSISVTEQSHSANIHKEATARALRRNTTVEPVTSILSQVGKLKYF
jgi:hypothetical protein